jgi:hypothetical protein
MSLATYSRTAVVSGGAGQVSGACYCFREEEREREREREERVIEGEKEGERKFCGVG